MVIGTTITTFSVVFVDGSCMAALNESLHCTDWGVGGLRWSRMKPKMILFMLLSLSVMVRAEGASSTQSHADRESPLSARLRIVSDRTPSIAPFRSICDRIQKYPVLNADPDPVSLTVNASAMMKAGFSTLHPAVPLLETESGAPVTGVNGPPSGLTGTSISMREGVEAPGIKTMR